MLLVTLVSIALDITATPGAPPPPTPIVGGTEAGTCDFPADVYIGNGGANCTASLIHPRVLVTAAHCLGGIGMAGFGESSYSPELTIAVQGCEANPHYYDWGLDLAVCVLAQDAPAVDMVPVLMGCEADELTPGHEVVIAGFGMSNEASGTGGGIKRFTSNTIDYVSWNANEIYLLGNANGSCYGDSGGPAYIQLSDGTWRVIAAVQGPHPNAPPLGCGFGGTYTLIHTQMEWIEQTTGYDVTPCFDADGTWNPDERCTDFPEQLHGFDASWASMCTGAPLSGPGQTCGAPHPDLDPDPDPEPDPEGETTGGDTMGVGDGHEPPSHGSGDGEPPDATTGAQDDDTDDASFDDDEMDDGGGAAPDPALPGGYGQVDGRPGCHVAIVPRTPVASWLALLLLLGSCPRARTVARRLRPRRRTRETARCRPGRRPTADR